MLCVEAPCCCWRARGDEARFTPLAKPTLFLDSRPWKPPSCFLLSHQQSTAVQEDLWPWPNDMATQFLPQGNLCLWNKWPHETTKQVSLQGLRCESLQHVEWTWLDAIKPDHRTIVSWVKECSSVAHCNHIHAYITKHGLDSDAFLGSTLIDVYAKCGSIEYACMVFDRLPQQDVVTWSAVILGHALHGLCQEAFHLFHLMQQDGTEPNDITCICLMKACSITGSLLQGKQIHVYVANRGLDSDTLIGNSLTDMYVKCGSLEDASLVFRKLQVRDVVAWNVLIGGHVQHGAGEEALHLFQQMQQLDVKPNETTFVSILQACASIEALGDGERAHNFVLENGFASNVYVGNTLVHMYAECGRLDEASTVFLTLPSQDVVSYNALISGYSQHGYVEEVFQIFKEMQNSEVKPNGATFVAALQACSSRAWLEEGTWMHSQIVKVGCELGSDVCSSLISMYARCGGVEDIKTLVYRLPQTGAITWNAIIVGFTQLGNVQEALLFFQQMQQEGIELTEAASICLIRACGNVEDLRPLMEIHAYIVNCGLEMELCTGNALIVSYCRSTMLEDACVLFNKLPHRDAASWVALIEGYVQDEHAQEALGLCDQMRGEVVGPESSAFVCILGVCSSTGDIAYGMQIHTYILKVGFDSDTIVSNTLISMYIKCGSLDDACMVFDCLLTRDVVTWNALIAGSVQHGHSEEALQLFQHMQEGGFECDQVTYVCVLQASSNLADLDIGQGIHTQMVKHGVSLDLLASNTLIDMYAKCNSSADAVYIFSRLPERDTVSWNVLIGAATQGGFVQEAFHMFHQMQMENLEPNRITFSSVLQACSKVADLKRGMQVHSSLMKRGYELDAFVGCSLIDMYAKCKAFRDAHKVFDSLPIKDAIVWNSLLAGYVQYGHVQEACELFEKMQGAGVEATHVTFLCILQVFSSIESVGEGRRVHALIIESGLLDSIVGNSLIDMYGRCWHLEDAAMVFNQSHNRDVLTWSAFISSHFNNGRAREALQLFKQMQHETINPDRVLFMLILKVCSTLAALEQGKQIHSLMVENGLELETSMGNTLIDMYANCGSLEDASIMFCRLPERDVVTWSVIISGYAEHSNFALALNCFENMQKEGLMPDNITYLSMLSACNNAGFVNEGSFLFKRMRDEHGLEPTVEHYNCIVDLLGRNGYISEAKDLIDTLPYRADIVAWTSLLGSCKIHKNLTTGQQCFDYLKNKGATGYVLMSSIFAQLGMQADSENVELIRRHEKMWKKPGKASIEIHNHVHEFAVGDNTHSQTNEIHAKLKSLNLRSYGNQLPSLDITPESLVDEGKEGASCGHCEKLAVALGLLCLPQGTAIRVTKNLRVCSDCHNDVKMISKIESREIIIVDSKCVHQFRDGICCCNGYG
eukprot:c17787_g1_i1 orf=1546-5700(-)